MTGSVRSLVNMILWTVYAPEGSIKSPTLSQSPAKDEGAKDSSFPTISFRSMPAIVELNRRRIKAENMHLKEN